MLGMASGNTSFIFVQKFLKIYDILSTIFDMRPLFKYLRFARSKDFKSIFTVDGSDMWALFRGKLAYGFCDSSMPHHILMETAYKMAFDLYEPGMSFTFLELFLASRVFNKAASLGNPATVRCDMQHASYAKDKTFILAERDRELQGKPDGMPIPVSEYYFVMGEICRDILIEDGFPPDNIFVTGSARFDHINGDSRFYPAAQHPAFEGWDRWGGICSGRMEITGLQAGELHKDNPPKKPMKVLMVTTLNVGLDFEMVKAASIASEGLDIKLHLRSHPLVKIEDMPEYNKYRSGITSSGATLEDDLNAADLMLFTYSTVAEEAFVKGVPVLRWQVNGFNGSVFKDLDVAGSAYSVESLKDAFRRFLYDPASFRPDEEQKNIVLRNCFYRTDGMAADRIAEKSIELLSRRPTPRTLVRE